MKVTERVTEFEGSEAEYEGLLRARMVIERERSQAVPAEIVPPTVVAVPGDAELDSEGSAELEKFIKRVLNRIPLSPGQREFFKVLYKAGDEGLFREELYKQMNRAPLEMAGLLGTLGRKIHATPGAQGAAQRLGIHPADRAGLVILCDCSPINGRQHYRQRPELKRVLESEGLV